MFWKFSFPQKQWRILCALSHTIIDNLPMMRNLLGIIYRALTWHEPGKEVLRAVLLLTAESLNLSPSGINRLDDWTSACWSLTLNLIGPCERARITPTTWGKTMLEKMESSWQRKSKALTLQGIERSRCSYYGAWNITKGHEALV